MGLMSVRNTEKPTGILQIFCRSLSSCQNGSLHQTRPVTASGLVDHPEHTSPDGASVLQKRAGPINSACAGSQPALLLDAGHHSHPHKVTSPAPSAVHLRVARACSHNSTPPELPLICPWATHTKMLAEISLWSTSPSTCRCCHLE